MAGWPPSRLRVSWSSSSAWTLRRWNPRGPSAVRPRPWAGLCSGHYADARMVAEVRREQNDRLYAVLYRATLHGLRPEMGRPLEVPEKRRVPELERLRLGPMRISGRAMQHAPERPGGTGWCPLG